MTTDAYRLAFLFKYGHAFNPEYTGAIDLECHQDAAAVVGSGKGAEIVASFQSFFAHDLDFVAWRYHARGLSVDGLIGPATRELIDQQIDQGRCGCPEFTRDGVVEANWPESCRGQLLILQTLGNHPAFSGINITDAWNDALEPLEEMIDVSFEFTDFLEHADIHATQGPLGGSTLAWSHLARNSCDVRLEQRYDTSGRTWRTGQLVPTISHEIMHALGANHSSDPNALIYPMINSDWKKPNATDLRILLQLGYNRRTEPLPPDPPDPIEPDPPIVIPPEPPKPPPKKGPTMNWLTIITALLPLLQNCSRSSGRESARAALAGPSPRAVRAVARETNREGRKQYGRRRWRDIGPALVEEAIEGLNNLSDAEIDDILDEIEELDE